MKAVGLWSRIKKAVKKVGKAIGSALGKIGNIHNRLGGFLWKGFLKIAKWVAVAIVVVTLIVTIPVGMMGVSSVVVVYRRENGSFVADVNEFDSDGKIVVAQAFYGKPNMRK